MLDLSDRHATRVTETPVQAEASQNAELPRVGQFVRHYKGGLYRVAGLCTIEATNEAGVLYQAVDPLARQDLWMRPVSDYAGIVRNSTLPRFVALRDPNPSALRRYLPEAVISDSVLERVLSSYDEPWRFFHRRWHILDMFDRAAARDLALSVEQALAILFHDLVYVPGSPEGQNERQSVLVMQAYKAFIGTTETDWTTVARIIEDTAAHNASVEASQPVLDLDIATLGDDPVHFCAADEMVWLESRHLLAEQDARKDFDTRRLRFLLALAERGPLFSQAMVDLEEKARTNLEGLRQAWVQKYGSPRG